MRYAEQLAFYAGGARLSGFDVDRLSLIGVEVEAPFAVVVLDMTAALHDYARRNVTLWMERLRVCEESNAWPGYLQCAAPWDLPPWLADRGDEDNA